MSEAYKIVKIGKDSAPTPVKSGQSKSTRRKSMRTYPRGVLKKAGTKIEAVKDPAKSPPVKSNYKSTLRLLTEKGEERRRNKIRKTIRSMPDDKVRNLLKASGLPVSKQTPPHIAKEILEGGMEAGMIVSG